MDRLSLRHPRFDGVEEADELLMAVSFHVLPDDGATVAAGSGGLPGLRVLSLRP